MFVRLKKMVKYIFASLLMLGSFLSAEAQQTKETDFGVWLDFAALKKFHNVSFGVVGEFYTRANSTSIDRISIGFKGEYGFLPWLNGGAGITWMNFKLPGNMERRQRFYFQVEPYWNYSGFTFSFRERLQCTLYPESNKNYPSVYYWRNRFEVAYRKQTSRFKPLASVESLYHLQKVSTKHFDEFRMILGTYYHFSINQKVKCYGMMTSTTSLNRFLLGVSYEVMF